MKWRNVCKCDLCVPKNWRRAARSFGNETSRNHLFKFCRINGWRVSFFICHLEMCLLFWLCFRFRRHFRSKWLNARNNNAYACSVDGCVTQTPKDIFEMLIWIRNSIESNKFSCSWQNYHFTCIVLYCSFNFSNGCHCSICLSIFTAFPIWFCEKYFRIFHVEHVNTKWMRYGMTL